MFLLSFQGFPESPAMCSHVYVFSLSFFLLYICHSVGVATVSIGE